MKVALLAGGTGGAKLAAGAQDLVGEKLSVLANTGDDVEVLGIHVSPAVFATPLGPGAK